MLGLVQLVTTNLSALYNRSQPYSLNPEQKRVQAALGGIEMPIRPLQISTGGSLGPTLASKEDLDVPHPALVSV